MTWYFIKILLAASLAAVSYQVHWWLPMVMFPALVFAIPNFGQPRLAALNVTKVHVMRGVFYVAATAYLVAQAVIFQKYLGSWYGWLVGAFLSWGAGGMCAAMLEPWLLWRQPVSDLYFFMHKLDRPEHDSDRLPATGNEDERRRPKRITVIGWFLIVWNSFLILAYIPQALYGLDMAMPEALFRSLSPTRIFFVVAGVAMLRQKNWARLAYLIVAPLTLGLNLVLGCFRLGIDNVYDRVPSIIVTAIFMYLLLSRRAGTWFKPRAEKLEEPPPPAPAPPVADPDDEHPELSLSERGEEAPSSFRILMEALQTRLEKEYTQPLLVPGWQHFVMASTVAGCVSLALRLHFDVPEEDRTPTELKMREHLQIRFPQSEQLYEDCYRFVTQSLTDIPRPERPKYTFPLIATWVIASIADGKELGNQEYIVGQLAYVYQNETVGYWNPERQQTHRLQDRS